MKKSLLYITLLTAGIAAASSCNLNEYPVFNDDDAFVAFDDESRSFDEPVTAGATVQVEVSVTLASVAGISTDVVYDAVSGTAVEGEDFDLADPSATLKFNQDNRTCTIPIILYGNNVGTYTGNKTFSLVFSDPGSVKEGAENTCTVTIVDMDHPLTPILATYSMTGESINGPAEWNLTFSPDESDQTIVWISSGLIPADEVIGEFYGSVTSQGIMPATISMGLGQTASDDERYVLYGKSADGTVTDSGTLTITISEDGRVISFNDMGPCVFDTETNTFVDQVSSGASGVKAE